MHLFKKTLLLFLLSSLLFSACNKDEDDALTKLEFSFSHTIDGAALVFDTIKFTNAAANTYSITTLKYFISDITLHKPSGEKVWINEEHYVDARDNSTLSFSPDMEIENGSFSHITFTFGLDSIKNVTGRFPNAPESNMEWPEVMGGGYHYMKMEGKFDSSGVVKNYNTHTGPTMGNQNYVLVTLPSSSFTASGATVKANITMNINEWYEDPNLYDFNVVGSAIMGKQNVQQMLKENGADAFSVSFSE